MTERTSPARKAIAYAEDQLKVHEVLNAALTAREGLAEAMARLVEARSSKRTYESQIRDREMDLTLHEAETHPSMSVAAMERHLKVTFHKDHLLRDLHQKVEESSLEIIQHESIAQLCEVDVKIATARMNELSGYLAYLAAVKQSQIVSEARQSRESGAENDH